MKTSLFFIFTLTVFLFPASLLAQDLLSELGVQPGTPQARQIEKWKQEFDANQDGVLDEGEKAELKKRFKESQQAEVESQDLDKDGKISDEERAIFANKIQKLKETLLKLHDVDGDGQLNEQERQRAQEWLAGHKQLPLR
jgi:hypothetical protein